MLEKCDARDDGLMTWYSAEAERGLTVHGRAKGPQIQMDEQVQTVKEVVPEVQQIVIVRLASSAGH